MRMRLSSDTIAKLRTTLGAFITGAVLVIPLFSKSSTDDVTYKAYRNPLNKPTICITHHEGVSMTDTATTEQCMEYIRGESVSAAAGVSTATPTILENKSAFRAASDFVITDGIDAYATSPMARHFAKREWVRGCNSFIGYRTWFHFSRPSIGNRCIHKARNDWVCQVGKIVQQRELEQQLCLGNAK